MKVATVYLNSGQSFEIYGEKFVVTFDEPGHSFRKVAWENGDFDKADPIYLAPDSVAAVVVRKSRWLAY